MRSPLRMPQRGESFGYGADSLVDSGSGDGMPGAGCVLREDGALAVVGGDGEEDVVESFEIEHSGSTVSDAARRCKGRRRLHAA